MTNYINFYIHTSVPVKIVCWFPNNKLRVTKDIKAIPNEKKRTFRSGSREAVKKVQKQLSVNIGEGMEAFRTKME